jgi:hypothetical protein
VTSASRNADLLDEDSGGAWNAPSSVAGNANPLMGDHWFGEANSSSARLLKMKNRGAGLRLDQIGDDSPVTAAPVLFET